MYKEPFLLKYTYLHIDNYFFKWGVRFSSKGHDLANKGVNFAKKRQGIATTGVYIANIRQTTAKKRVNLAAKGLYFA